MYTLLAKIMEIFEASSDATARKLASQFRSLSDHDLVAKSPSGPNLENLERLSSQSVGHPGVRGVMASIHKLAWSGLDSFRVPHDVIGRSAVCEIAGPDGYLKTDTFRLGLCLQSPEVLYPSHSHNAEEVFYVMSGTALWQHDSGPFVPKDPGALIHHNPNQPHAIQSQKEILMVIWAWTGDIGFESYRFAV